MELKTLRFTKEELDNCIKEVGDICSTGSECSLCTYTKLDIYDCSNRLLIDKLKELPNECRTEGVQEYDMEEYDVIHAINSFNKHIMNKSHITNININKVMNKIEIKYSREVKRYE